MPDPISVLDRLRARREQAEAAARTLIAGAEAEDRDLSDDELSTITTHRADMERRDAQIADLEALEQRAQRAARVESQSQPGRPLSSVTTVTVTRHEPVYRPDGGPSFLRDLMAARQGDFDAADRLRRNNADGTDRERRDWARARAQASSDDRDSGEIVEVRDGTTGATSMGSFIPPVWLLDEVAQRARAGRVLAGRVRDGGFPTTNSITIPRITTGASVASQASENAAVSETDWVTAQLTRSTVTIAGQQDMAVQSIDLSPYNVEAIVFADLAAAYEAELDRQILRGSGASGELLGINAVAGINAVTYTDASPTVAELYPKFADSIQQIDTARFLSPDTISVHPRRWGWLSAAVDTQNRPLIVPSGAGVNVMAAVGAAMAEGRVGEIQGIDVFKTASHATNLGAGTNEDQIVVFRGSDMVLMESPQRTRVLSEVLSGNLTVRLQLYAYVNFFAGRFPAAIATIGGTGLVAPTF